MAAHGSPWHPMLRTIRTGAVNTSRGCLRKGARAALQFYPETAAQAAGSVQYCSFLQSSTLPITHPFHSAQWPPDPLFLSDLRKFPMISGNPIFPEARPQLVSGGDDYRRSAALRLRGWSRGRHWVSIGGWFMEHPKNEWNRYG